MNEEQLEVLLANGYDYNYGGIIDSEGKYVSSVTIGEYTMTSELSEEDWAEYTTSAEQAQQKASDPVENIEQFKNDPLNTVLTEEAKNYYPTYSQEQEERGEDTYENVELFEKYSEEEALQNENADPYVGILRSLQEEGHDITNENIEAYKSNESKIKKIESENPNWILQDRDSDLYKQTKEDAENLAWYNPKKYLSQAMLYLTENIVYNLTPDDAGMQGSDEEKQEYLDALAKRKELRTPGLNVISEKLKVKQQQIQEKLDNISYLDMMDLDNEILRYGASEVDSKIEEIKAYTEGDKTFNPFSDDKFFGNITTLGLQGAFDNYMFTRKLHEKINNGEELTENEKLVAETLATISESQGIKMDQTGLYGLTRGTLESASFLVGGAPGRVIMKGATKAATLGTAKSLMKVGVTRGTALTGGKIIGESVNMLGQAVLHPDAHTKALQKYYGDIYFDTDEKGDVKLTTDRRTYNTLLKEIEIEEDKLDSALYQTKDAEEAFKIRTQLMKLQDYKASLKEPVSAFDAGMYGFTEVLKENMIENYGGLLANKVVNNRYTRKLGDKPWISKVKNSQLGKLTKKANNLFGGVKEKFNTMLGNTGSKLMSNNLGEMAEEIMVQLTPVWGETEEEAKRRKGELLETSFYGQVAGQTLLMGALMKGVYSPVIGYNAYKKYQDLKGKRKAFKDMINEFKTGGMSNSQVEELLMSAGQGNYTVQEYNNKIHELREKGRNEEANNIERNKTFNIGKSLVKIGRGKRFVKEMERAISQNKIPQESIKNVMDAVKEVKILQNEMKEFEGLKNRDYILELKSKQRYTNSQRNQLEKRKEELYSQPESPQRDGEIKGIEDAISDINTTEGMLAKALAKETSPKMVEKLRQEQEVSKYIYSEFNKLKKEAKKNNIELSDKSIRELAIENAKNKYEGTVSNGTYKNAIKNSDRSILKDFIAEAQRNIQNNKNQEVKETEEESIQIEPEVNDEDSLSLNTHIEDIENNIESIGELMEEKLGDPDSREVVDYGKEPDFDPDKDFQEDSEWDNFFDDMPMNSDGSYQHESFNSLVNSLKDRVSQMEKRDGQKPSFEDYIGDLLDNGEVPLENFKYHTKKLALVWRGARLGNPKWNELYSKMFEDQDSIQDRIDNENPGESDFGTELKQQQEKTEEKVVNRNSKSKPITYESTSGEPVYTTPNSNKTYGTDHKLNYSAIEYETKIEEVDGKKVVTKTNSPIPKFNENSRISIKDLVHPDKNNIGDNLFPVVLEGEELLNQTVPVRDKYGIVKTYVPFSTWVEQNKGDMSIEEFQKTQLYKDKVPMVYKDASGTPVAFVPEVEWFSVTSVGDSNKEVDEVDLDNPSQSLINDIEKNREQTSTLRNQILNGEVSKVVITDNLGFPPLQKIAEVDNEGNSIPPKKLNEVSPDSEIVFMKSTGGIYDLQGNKINMDNILNLGNQDEGFLMRETIEEDGIRKSLPINRNRTHYLVHTTTVDGEKKYIALNTLRKNEESENSANKEDVETARWIAAINKITAFKDTPSGSTHLRDVNHPYHMTAEQAEDLRRQIKEITGIDVKSKYSDILEALIAFQSEDTVDNEGNTKKGKKITYGSKFIDKLLAYNKQTGEVSNPSTKFVQNTKFNFNSPMITIKKTENGFKVEKVKITPKVVDGKTIDTADNYSDFLKERLSTNIMGYNVGTTNNPKYTIAVQQKIVISPIVDSKKETIEDKVEKQKVTEEVKDKIEEVQNDNTSKELNKEQKEERKQIVEDATSLAKELNLDIRNIEEVDDLVVSEMTSTDEIDNSILITEGITIKQEEDVIKWMFSKLADRNATFTEVSSDLENDLKEKIKKLEDNISKLEKYEDSEVVSSLKNTLEKGKEQAEKVLEVKDKLLKEASLRAMNTAFITDEFEDNSENIKDFSKANNEIKPIDKVGTALKRIFAQINNGKTGFMGLDTFASFKQMYDNVTLSLSSDVNLEPNFDNMMALLEKREDSTLWMKPLIAKLKEADDQVKNQFVYNTYRQKVYAKFAVLSYNKEKGINSNIYDSNANEAKRAVIDNWRENFKRGTINNDGLINNEVLKEAISEWNSWFDSGTANQSTETYKNWLSKFGITLSDKTWEALRNGELNVSESGGKLQKVPFEELFEGLTGNNSTNRTGYLFTNLMKFAMINKDKEEVEFYENSNNHPFKDMNTILNQLSELEVKYNPSYGSTSRYVSGKSLTEIESFNYFYEQFKKLKKSALSEDKKYLEKLSNLNFSKDSFILNLLKNDAVFANQFGHGLVDLMALKELYKKSPMFAGIDELSSIDYMFAQRAMFQNRNQGGEKSVDGVPFDIRLAHMNTLTNSDKGRMMLLKTAVFDFYKESDNAFSIDENGITFKEDLRNLLYNQLVMPELNRMINFITNIKQSNIKSYDKGAVRFNLIPGLNTLTNSEGQSIYDIITTFETEVNLDKSNLKQIQDKITQKIKDEFFNSISDFIQDNVVSEALSNVEDLKQFQTKVDGFNNADYLKNRKGDIKENMQVAELDFILNSMLTNMNYMQLMAGDPALYYKAKGDPTSKNINEQTKISQSLAINLGKRMAAMIAPGSVLANSQNNRYKQVFLEDINGIADNILDIVSWHYSKKELDEKHENGFTYKEMFEETKKGNRDYIKLLSNRFDRIAEFIDIESTDAQEYTTTKEQLYILEKQGRIPKDILDKIKEKLKKQNEFLSKKGNTIDNMPKEYFLNEVIKDVNKSVNGLTELQLLLQPIKPVYTGTIYDSEQDVNRMVYIKSSSFPLIPELTAGRKLDDLRLNMERAGISRASYQTANKVGALTSDNTITDFKQPILPNNTLELDRSHFKIQQDVPFKSKKVQDDTVSMGTQIFKLLMGDGIMEMDNFIFEGKEMTGKELQQEFHNIFSKMIGMKKNKFLKNLGLDKNMKPVDSKTTIEKLQKLLIREAKSRGFSKQDLKILNLVDNGDGQKTFKLPLWMTGNSNKYESMLNALINNKIFKQKIPGNKFVTASEAGFQMKENFQGVDKSRIIHVGNYNGQELGSTKNKEGKLEKAQILVPSKFKIGGRLIDLFEEFDGQVGTYLQRNKNGVIELKSDMVDKGLLEQFVFRIPTSSHGLGSSVEVVGFLPPESGDLIITPKGFVAQMGQDFDIDSLTAYQYNHIVMEDGSIKELTEETKEAYLEEKNRLLNDLQYQLKNKGLENLLPSLETDSNVKEEKNSFKEYLQIIIDAQVSTDEEIKDLINEIRKDLSRDYDLKILENKFIKIHNSVYSNPQAQKNINKVLSMSFAEKQADEIEGLTLSTDNTFNILSPKYQMNKMNAGSTGQDAIGIYAKGVTLHSMIQQAKSLGNKIGLGKVSSKGNVPKNIKIGNLSSDGTLGNTFSLKSKNPLFDSLNRRISTILDERTNTGTDNEKAQILGRTGLNHSDAIAVDNLLSLLGFDAEYSLLTKEQYDENKPFHRETLINGKKVYYTERSVPYLLHSQPIIKEYFSIINEKESITTEFSGKAKEEALKELIDKYANKDVPGDLDVFNGRFGYWISDGDKDTFISNQDNSKFTSEMLQNQIVLNESSDKNSQLEILAMYIDLISQAKKVKTMMQHVDLNNLGKSMWESSTKAKEFRDFFTKLDESGIIGAEHLIGEVSQKEGDLIDGQLDLGDNKVLTPKTNQGVMVGTALSLSEALFSNLFPAKNKYINYVINSIINSSNINSDNAYAVIKAKEQIFQEIKKYLTSARQLGIFNKEASEVRKDLFIDDFKNGKLSLSSYLGNLFTSNSNEYKKGINKVKNNLFLNHLKYTVGENGKPSLITFNNQESFEANQEAIYASFKELISEDVSLPRKNGEYYSTRLLAQELIAYSYSSGGIVQGALEFHKFLPIEYLDDMFVEKNGKKVTISQRLRNFNNFNQVGENKTKGLLSRFNRQYFQNNPESAVQMKMKENTLSNGLKIYSSTLPTDVDFIAQKVPTKSKLKQDKWKLYERVPGEKYYREISVLGETGMSEYEAGQSELTSILQNKEDRKDIQISELETIEHKKLGMIPKSGTKYVDFLNAISKGEYGNYENIQEISKYLMQFVDENKVFNYDTEGKFKGRASQGNVTINPNNISSNEELVTTFVHEIIHSITSEYINQYFDEFGDIKGNAPSELISLNNVLKSYKDNLASRYPDEYSKFMEKWNTYRKNRNEGKEIPVSFTDREISIFYPTVNLKEFIATTLGNNKEFKKEASTMEYLETKGSVLKKFGDIIVKLIKRIAKTEGIKENSVALQAILKGTELIESIPQNIKTVENKVEKVPEITKEEMEMYNEMYANEPEFFEENFTGTVDYGTPPPNLEGPIERNEDTIDLVPMKKTENKCK